MYKQLILDLFDHQMIKFGEFTLKSGKQSHIYLDMRSAIAYPKILHAICECYIKIMKSLKYDQICGVPYSALAFASCIAYSEHIPMLLKRKEVKNHGTKKVLEGTYQKGDTCLIIEDVITTGNSLIETAHVVEEHGLKVKDVCVLISREEAATENLTANGYAVHSIMTLEQIIDVLFESGKIDPSEKRLSLQALKPIDFIKE